VLGTLIIVAACLAAAALARWRRWAPPLVASLVIGLLARTAVVLLARQHTPHDVGVSFHIAGQDVLDGRDPVTSLPRYQWNFLPFSAYLFAAEIKTGLSWQYASKLLPVASDVATIALVSRLAPGPAAGRRAALLYALAPPAILVAAWHGQLEPVCVFLGLGALLLARSQRAIAAGLAVGLAIASKTWPVLFLPGVLLQVPLRSWWRVVAAAAAMLAGWAVIIPLALHDSLRKAAGVIVGYQSFAGSWGWSGLLRYARLAGAGYAGHNVDVVQRAGTLLTAAAVVAVLVGFGRLRRRSPEDVTVAVILAFLVTTAGAGPQYLLWPVALLCAAGRRSGYAYILLATAWTGLFYLYAFPRGEGATHWAGAALEAVSIAVILAAIAAMPWRGHGGPPAPLESAGPLMPASQS
jgi:hypothetical protein